MRHAEPRQVGITYKQFSSVKTGIFTATDRLSNLQICKSLWPFVCMSSRIGLSCSEAGKLGGIASKNIKNWLTYQERIVDYYKNPKRCPICNKPIQYSKKRENKFCSQSCAAIFNNLKRNKNRNIIHVDPGSTLITKPGYNKNKYVSYCLNCGLQISNRQKFCSNKCTLAYKSFKMDNEIENGNIVSQRRLRNYLLKRNTKCMNPECCWDWSKCGSISLEVHHIDGNPNNNILSNVILLCPNCHSQTETYKAKNIGNGRSYRRQRYKEGKSF